MKRYTITCGLLAAFCCVILSSCFIAQTPDAEKSEPLTKTTDHEMKTSNVKTDSGELELILDGDNYTIVGLGTSREKHLEIPARYNGKPVTRIAPSAFRRSGIESAAIPESVTEVGDSAFYQCENLRCVTIAGKLTAIEKYTFYECGKLEEVNIPDSVETIGWSAFRGCFVLKEARFGNRLHTIKGYAFMNCKELRVLELPETLKELGAGAFMGCENLVSAPLPDGIKRLELDLFNGCVALTDVQIPASTEHIGSKAFYKCEKVHDLVIPDGVTSIGDAAFYGCKSITRISVPDSVLGRKGPDFEGFVFWKGGMFAYCTSLAEVSLGNGIKMIVGKGYESDTAPFEGCTALETVTGLPAFRGNLFEGCDSLKTIGFRGTEEEWNETVELYHGCGIRDLSAVRVIFDSPEDARPTGGENENGIVTSSTEKEDLF